MTTVKELIEYLQHYYKPEEVLAVAIWQVEDVFERAKERKLIITKKQAEDIIVRIERDHSASLGINWDTIDAYLDEVEEYGT